MIKIDPTAKKIGYWDFSRFQAFIRRNWEIKRMMNDLNYSRMRGAIGGVEAHTLDNLYSALTAKSYLDELRKVQNLQIPYTDRLKRAVGEISLILEHYHATNAVPQTNIRRLQGAIADFDSALSSTNDLCAYVYALEVGTWD